MIVSLTKNTPTQRAFSRTLPESPLPSQKQAKLLLSTKSRFYPPKLLLSKTPHPPRIAAFIAKTTKARFYSQLWLVLSSESRFYPQLCLIFIQIPDLTKSSPAQMAFFRTLPESPLPSQKQAKLVLSAKACFYPQLWLVLPTKSRSSPESPLQS